MTKLSELSDYSGIDVSNEISLFEYGLLVKETENEVLCYYQESNEGQFGAGVLDKSFIDGLINESWFNKNSFLDWNGSDEQDWLNCSYATKLHDLIMFVGIENIFGSSYFTFEIEND